MYICESVLMHIVCIHVCKYECVSLYMHVSVCSMPTCLCIYVCDSAYVPRKESSRMNSC